MTDKIRWGILGAGGFADQRAIPWFKQARNAALQAVMTPDQEKAGQVAAKHGIPLAFSRVEHLVECPEIDAVYIATPVDYHLDHVLAAAQAGKHVFCEKPMATSLEECREMIRQCEQRQVRLGIAYMMRYRPQCRIARKYIDEDRLGNIVYGRAQNTFWYPPLDNAWRQELSRSRGGVLFDIGSHAIDTLRFLFGEIQSVQGMTGFAQFPYPVDDTALALLYFDNKALGIVDVSWAVPHREAYLEIYGTQGSLVVEQGLGPSTNPRMRLLDSDGSKEVALAQENAYTLELEAMSQALLDDHEPEVNGQEGMRITEIILAIYHSADNKEPVSTDL